MSMQRFTPEFKQEAVRQIVERGYSVAEVSARLGVSSHSLYKWVKAIKPDKAEKQASELIEGQERDPAASCTTASHRRRARYPKKSRAVLCQGARIKYRFINEHRQQFRIMTMCRVLSVARAGFYHWLHHPLSDRAIEDRRLLGLIRDSHTGSGGVYGSPRVFGDLREAGESCGKHRVARIMRTHKIRAIRGYKTPRAIEGRPSILAPNRLNREFTVDTPDRAWVTDISVLQ
jgi:putative transposase